MVAALIKADSSQVVALGTDLACEWGIVAALIKADTALGTDMAIVAALIKADTALGTDLAIVAALIKADTALGTDLAIVAALIKADTALGTDMASALGIAITLIKATDMSDLMGHGCNLLVLGLFTGCLDGLDQTEGREWYSFDNAVVTQHAAGQLHVVWRDGDALGVNGHEDALLEYGRQVRLGGLLQGQHRGRLETQVGPKALSYLPHHALEGHFRNEQPGGPLVLADLAQRHRACPVAVGLLHAAAARCRGIFFGCLSGLFPAPSAFLGVLLLGAGHDRC
jgi:hypothetical protein